MLDIAADVGKRMPMLLPICRGTDTINVSIGLPSTVHSLLSHVLMSRGTFGGALESKRIIAGMH